MKKEINPVIAIVVVAIIVLVIGYTMWQKLFPSNVLPPLPADMMPGAIAKKRGMASPAGPTGVVPTPPAGAPSGAPAGR